MVVSEGITEEAAFGKSFERSDGISPREIWKWKKNNCEETEGKVSVAGVEGTRSVVVRL